MSRTKRNWHGGDKRVNKKHRKSKRKIRANQRERKYDKGFIQDK